MSFPDEAFEKLSKTYPYNMDLKKFIETDKNLCKYDAGFSMHTKLDRILFELTKFASNVKSR